MSERTRKPHYDVEAIRRAAKGRWTDILAGLGIDRKALRNIHGPCPGCGGTDRFRYDNKDGRGSWICGGGGNEQAGDGLALLQHVHGWTFPRALQEVAKMLAIQPDNQKNGSHAETDDETRRIERARKLVSEAQPAAGTLAEKYLAARGIPAEVIVNVLYHPDVRRKAGDNEYRAGPAALFPATTSDGRLVAVQAVFLGRDGQALKDASGKKIKRTFGVLRGTSAVFVANDGGGATVGCDAPEDACSLATALPKSRCVATLGTSNVANLESRHGRLLWVADNGDPAELVAAERKLAELHDAGMDIYLAKPADPHKDANDVLHRDGVEALRRLCRRPPRWEPPPIPERSQPETARPNAVGDGFTLEWFGDAELETDHRDFVEGVLTEGGMSVVYGESNSGKTFFATDLAMRVALGWDWQGRETDPGGVLYLALEGGYGIRNRELAFRHEYSVTARAPFATVRASASLRDDGDVERVIAAARAMREQTGTALKLVVVDTLSRALAGGEENSSQDMGALVAAVDRVRRETGAHVMLIHHSGKDQARGARGHSLLRAATDTEIEVVRPDDGDVATAVVKKQRDLPCEGRFAFSLRSVTLGTDRRGNPITSCVVEPEEPPERTARAAKLSERQQLFLDGVRNAIIADGQLTQPLDGMSQVRAVDRQFLRQHLADAGVFDASVTGGKYRSRVHDYLMKLKTKGVLGFSDRFVWLPETPVSRPSAPSAPRQQPVSMTPGAPSAPSAPPYKGADGLTPMATADADPGWTGSEAVETTAIEDDDPLADSEWWA